MKVGAGHRPGLGAGLVGRGSRRSPAAISQSALAAAAWNGSRGRRDRLAVLVDHLGVGQLVLLGVGVLDIADRALGLGDVVGDAFVALGADADRPLDRGVGADLRSSSRRSPSTDSR